MLHVPSLQQLSVCILASLIIEFQAVSAVLTDPSTYFNNVVDVIIRARVHS